MTEKINNKVAIILQRLINPIPNPSKVKELNYILQYLDCIDNPNMELNIGGCGGIKPMEVAKEKLRPIRKQQMIRIKSNRKLTREEYFNITTPKKPKGFF